MSEFKDMLIYLRKREGLSQRELASKLHISPGAIGMYESGKRYPTREIEEGIADIFNVNLNVLRGIDTPAKKMDILSEAIADEEALNAIRKMLALSSEKKEALYKYIDFLSSAN